MSRNLLGALGAAVIVLAVAAYGALFTVTEAQQALVLQFGEAKRIIREPGLQAKIPFIQNVIYYDRRVLDYDPVGEEVIAADQKRMVVDTYTRYRIIDPLQFYQRVRTEQGVALRLGPLVTGALRRVIGNVTLASVLSEERAGIMENIRDQVRLQAEDLGIEVIDVRIRRADLPEQNSQAIYDRMQSEREREAREFRAQGAELGQRIRSRADRERTVIIAEARKQSQILRGEGEADSVRIYAEAFGKDAEFFAFYRSMEAYREALGDPDTTMVLSPESDFFRYFRDVTGGRR